MAKAEFGGDVRGIRGKRDKQIYSHRRGGSPYSKRVAKHIYNPHSPAQQAVRDFAKVVEDQWHTFTENERQSWNSAFVVSQQRKNTEQGDRHIIPVPQGQASGYNNYFEANMLAFSVGQKTIIRRPTHLKAPAHPMDLTAFFVKEAGAIRKLVVAWNEVPEATASHFVRVWVFSALPRRFHKQFAAYAPAADKKLEITQVRGKGGEVLELSDCKETWFLIQSDTVDRNSGLGSNASLTIQVRLLLTLPLS